MPDADTAQAQAGQHGDTSPKYVTAEDIERIVEQKLGGVVNSAVSSQLKRTLGKELGPALEKAIAPLKDALTKREPTTDEPSDEPGNEPDAQPAATQRQGQQGQRTAQAQQQGKAQPDPEVLKLRKTVELLEGQMKAEQKRAAEERQRAIEAKGYAEVQQALSDKVRPEAVPIVLDLFRARQRVTFTDEGDVRIRIRASFDRGMPEEERELSPADAIAHFIKTKEAALFLPPPGQAGPAGQRTPNRQATTAVPRPQSEPARREALPTDEREAARRTREALEAQGMSGEDLLG